MDIANENIQVSQLASVDTMDDYRVNIFDGSCNWQDTSIWIKYQGMNIGYLFEQIHRPIISDSIESMGNAGRLPRHLEPAHAQAIGSLLPTLLKTDPSSRN